jgi:uncharacterized protein (TIGR00369 family)
MKDGCDLKSLIAQARATGELTGFVQAIPFSRYLNLEVSRDGEGLLTTMRFAPHLIGNSLIPALHGGTLGALLESSAIFSLLWDGQTERTPKTINITVQFLRSAAAVDTYARAEITRQGRRVATIRASAWQESREKPVAAATAHFLLAGRDETPRE